MKSYDLMESMKNGPYMKETNNGEFVRRSDVKYLMSLCQSLAELMGEYRERVIKGEITGRLLNDDYEPYIGAIKILREIAKEEL